MDSKVFKVDPLYTNWYNAYEEHLQYMYNMCKTTSIKEMNVIEFDDFCVFIYKKSSKYISEWL